MRVKRDVETHYDVLGMPPASAYEELHTRFKELAVENHPDKFKMDSKKQKEASERFYKISGAWAILRNEMARRAYDEALRMLTVLNCVNCNGKGIHIRTLGFRRQERTLCEKCGGKGHL